MISFRDAVGHHILRRVVVPGIVVYLALVGAGLLLAFPLEGLVKPARTRSTATSPRAARPTGPPPPA